jgi:integrase/recombinase XerD
MSTRARSKKPDLAALFPSWEIALGAERKSPKTIRVYGDSVRAFLRWSADTGNPAELTTRSVQAFITTILAAGAQANTARSRQQALRRFSAWLVAEGELDTDQLLGLKPPQVDVKVMTPLDTDELKALLKACKGVGLRERRDEAIVRLMAETGARAGEVAAMQLDDIDLRRGIAVIRRGKGGRGRIVPFGPQTSLAIDRYLRTRRDHRLTTSTALWLGDRGKTHSYSAMQRSLGKRATAAGIARFHPHLLRHTAATRWLRAGGSEGGLMAVAGWKSREMLDRYVAATASERAADEARKLNLGELD